MKRQVDALPLHADYLCTSPSSFHCYRILIPVVTTGLRDVLCQRTTVRKSVGLVSGSSLHHMVVEPVFCHSITWTGDLRTLSIEAETSPKPTSPGSLSRVPFVMQVVDYFVCSVHGIPTLLSTNVCLVEGSGTLGTSRPY